MSSMAKLKDSRSCFITRWRVFYKWVQLVQGEIMLISITIILLSNFEKKKTSHSSFCVFETSKLVSPQFLLFTLVCFREKNGEKNLQLTSINFVYMRLPDLQRIARIAIARPEKQSLKKYNATISIYINLIFCYVIQNLSVFNICKNWG